MATLTVVDDFPTPPLPDVMPSTRVLEPVCMNFGARVGPAA